MDWRIHAVVDFMERNIHRDVTLEDLAHVVQVSPWHLSRLFKAATGTTPLGYFKCLKLEYAKRLLASTLLSVKEVRVKVGIIDESHFFRDFKSAFGSTPKNYRRDMIE